MPFPFTPLAPGIGALEAPALAFGLDQGEDGPPSVDAEREIVALVMERGRLLEEIVARNGALDAGPGDGWDPYPHRSWPDGLPPPTLRDRLSGNDHEIATVLRRSGRLPVTWPWEGEPDPALVADLASREEEIAAAILAEARNASDDSGGFLGKVFLNEARIAGDRCEIGVGCEWRDGFDLVLRPGRPPAISGWNEEDEGPTKGLSCRWVTYAPSAGPARDLYEDLCFAAMGGGTEDVRRLIADGADPDLPEGNAPTPLAHAAEWFEPETVRALLELGADPFRRSNGRTALGLAREQYAGLSWVWSEAGDPGRAMAREFGGDDGGIPLYDPATAHRTEAIIHLLEMRMGLEVTPFV